MATHTIRSSGSAAGAAAKAAAKAAAEAAAGAAASAAVCTLYTRTHFLQPNLVVMCTLPKEPPKLGGP